MAHSCGVPAAIFKMFHPKVPYLLTLQEGDPPEYIQKKMRPLYPLFKRAFKKADFVQTISTFLAQWARRMGYAGPLEVVPNAVNTKHFSQQYPQAELDALKKKLGKKDGDIFIITTSRLVSKNGIADVIESLKFLPENYKFIILGIGPLENELKLLTTNYKLQTRVLFLGQIDHKEIPKYLKVSDIFTRPSLSEGMGNSFVEAMAADLPVVATQEGGIADFLFDAKRNQNKPTTGWAVDKDSPEQIAEVVKDILAHPEQVARVKMAAKKLVFENYDWNLIASKMKTVFDRLLDAPNG